MSVVLPSTVEEINCMQNPFQYNQLIRVQHVKGTKEDFSNIEAGKFKRLLSIPCPEGVQWNDMPDYDTYLTFTEPNLVNVEVTQSHEDRLVPGEEQRPRSESISSVTSSMDDKSYGYNSLGVKTFSTVCVDSGSTCISSDHSYVSFNPSVFKDLEAEETFQNLHPLLSQGPELHNTDTTSSSISSANSPLSDNLGDSLVEYSVLSNISMISNNSQDSSFSDRSTTGFKRSATSLDDDLFGTVNSPKRICESPDGRFSEMRRKNNAASKTSRKTRKEKQKEMENRVTELTKEQENLHKTIRNLELMTGALRNKIASIMRPIL